MALIDDNQEAGSSHQDFAGSNISEEKQCSGETPPVETVPLNTLSSSRTADWLDDKSLPAAGTEETVHFNPAVFLPPASIDAYHHSRLLPTPKTNTLLIPNAGRMISLLIAAKTGKSAERDATYRLWLATRSKEDLIEMILGQADPDSGSDDTHKLAKIRLEPLNVPLQDHALLANLSYLRLPVLNQVPLNQAPSWRIALLCIDQPGAPLALQIDSEITVGRSAGDITSDLDLTAFGAKTKGVSRIHARIRPELHRLLLIDNDSSNGTFWNKMRLPSNTEQALREGDLITFGRANFLVRIIKSPSVTDTKTLM